MELFQIDVGYDKNVNKKVGAMLRNRYEKDEPDHTLPNGPYGELDGCIL
jgi:hypothetical protein